MRISCLFALFVVLVGCGGATTNYSCPAVAKPAVVVEVRDAVTSSPIGAGSQGFVREGGYTDPLIPYEVKQSDPSVILSLQAALNRPGTYSVEVQHQGYQTWTATGVRVTSDACGVVTMRVRADLVPSA